MSELENLHVGSSKGHDQRFLYELIIRSVGLKSLYWNIASHSLTQLTMLLQGAANLLSLATTRIPALELLHSDFSFMTSLKYASFEDDSHDRYSIIDPMLGFLMRASLKYLEFSHQAMYIVVNGEKNSYDSADKKSTDHICS
jgi:hypothetical protein